MILVVILTLYLCVIVMALGCVIIRDELAAKRKRVELARIESEVATARAAIRAISQEAQNEMVRTLWAHRTSAR